MAAALDPDAKLAKPLVGVVVFVAVVLAWLQFGGSVMRHVPLPGADGPQGRCAAWFVGSSTMYRWKTMADDMAPWRTANRGVNGALADDVAARLAAETIRGAPGTVVVYLGENDIADGATAARTGAKVAVMVADIERRMPGTRILVLGMKPSPARWSFRPEQLRFNALVADLVKRTPNATFVDFGSALLVDGQPGPYYDSGGIHLNRDGYRIWATQIRAAMLRTTPAADMAHCRASFRASR